MIPAQTAPPPRVRVGAQAQTWNLINAVAPVYPPPAKQRKIQGIVTFEVLIGTDGHVLDAKLASGHPLLVPNALEAVRKYTYHPTIVKGEAAEVLTTVDIPFRIAADSQGQEFEVATVKQSPPPAGDLININLGNIRNGKLTLGNASLSDCLKFAWGITSDAQLAGPDWIKSKAVRFDIVAQSPPDTDRDTQLLMLRRLLADRLGIMLHHEQKTLPYLALTVAKYGPKLTASKGVNGNSAAAGRISATAISMVGLATLLSRFERQTVVDMTGLNGLFELNLEWAPEAAGDAPSLYTAVQEQLGLKLESRKGPLDVLVIDQAEKIPTAN